MWKSLKRLNLQMSEAYVRALFKQVLDKKPGQNKDALDEDGFFEVFRILSDLPEYRTALRLASSTNEESMSIKDLIKFLKEEQGFNEVDEKKAESLIQLFETGEDKKTSLSINGRHILSLISTSFKAFVAYFRVAGVLS